MSFATTYDAATDDASLLRKQVAVALHIAATNIANESEATEDHDQRLAWARRVFADPVQWSARSVWTVLQNSTILASLPNSTDNDVQFVVNSNIANFIKMV